jgi:hypothetical protein
MAWIKDQYSIRMQKLQSYTTVLVQKTIDNSR